MVFHLMLFIGENSVSVLHQGITVKDAVITNSNKLAKPWFN